MANGEVCGEIANIHEKVWGYNYIYLEEKDLKGKNTDVAFSLIFNDYPVYAIIRWKHKTIRLADRNILFSGFMSKKIGRKKRFQLRNIVDVTLTGKKLKKVVREISPIIIKIYERLPERGPAKVFRFTGGPKNFYTYTPTVASRGKWMQTHRFYFRLKKNKWSS